MGRKHLVFRVVFWGEFLPEPGKKRHLQQNEPKGCKLRQSSRGEMCAKVRVQTLIITIYEGEGNKPSNIYIYPSQEWE